MKAFSFFILLSLFSINAIFCAPRNVPPTPITFIPMPMAIPPQSSNYNADDKRDQELFGHFLNVLASFGKILLNPEDLTQAKDNAVQIIDSIVNIATTIMKRSDSVRTRLAMRKILDELSQLTVA